MADRRNCISLAGLSAGIKRSQTVGVATVLTISLVRGLAVAAGSAVKQSSEQSAAEQPVAEWADGAYQVCTEPDPQNGRDGAGVCLNFVKQGAFLEGYYGYPHSDAFVCLRGEVSEQALNGEGYVVSWAGNIWPDVPAEEAAWDESGRLMLGPGERVQTVGEELDQISWIYFQRARLNLQGLYRYAQPRMTPPAQLCDWSFLQSPEGGQS